MSMKQQDSLEAVGKRLPYEVPNGAHEELRGRILSATQRAEHHRRMARKVALWSSSVAAAVVAIVLVAGTLQPKSEESFDQMLAQLSDEECNALVASYSNDVFFAFMEE